MKSLKFFLFFLVVLTSLSSMAKTVVVLGDSLTEGYQLSRQEAFPALMEASLKGKYPDIKIINGGFSGATSASGPSRLNWYLKSRPDILVLALGANDGLRGLSVKETEKNLTTVIEKSMSSGVRVVLLGMKMPVNYGSPYREDFEKIFSNLAKKFKLPFLPFLLEGVGGVAKLNLPDGIHPNPEGHKMMAKNVLKVLGPLL